MFNDMDDLAQHFIVQPKMYITALDEDVWIGSRGHVLGWCPAHALPAAMLLNAVFIALLQQVRADNLETLVAGCFMKKPVDSRLSTREHPIGMLQSHTWWVDSCRGSRKPLCADCS